MTERATHQEATGFNLGRRLLRDILIILFLSAGLAIGVNEWREDGIALIPKEAPPPTVVAMGDSTAAEGTPSITPADAAAVLDEGTGVFIDARDRYAYAEAHIPGARHLDLMDMDHWMVEFYNTTQPDASLIVYCEAANCSGAAALASRLTEMGFGYVYILEGGWEKWRAENLPIEEGLPQ